MELRLDPDADDAYDAAPDPVAEWADVVFRWLEEEPINVQARRLRFAAVGNVVTWCVTRYFGSDQWVILWEVQDDVVYVRYLGPPPAQG